MTPSLRAFLAGAALLVLAPAHAGPGAHGPNGEHLDGPATAAPTGSLPRLEAKSEAFELVATLSATELSIFIDRFATNEPVLKATVEVETDGLKAIATMHADHGDYTMADAAMLKRLSTPGSHALVFTVTAGDEADLLEGALVTPQPAAAGAAGLPTGAIAAAAVAALAVGSLAFAWRRRLARPSISIGGAR
mgnify:CR=1 FL=1